MVLTPRLQETAATALFVATKVEENMRKFGELVAACVRAAQKNHTMQVHRDDKEFWKWKDCILTKEDYLLESICFDLETEPPYTMLLLITKRLGVRDRELIRIAWTFINDSTLTMLCVLYPSKTIAAAALYCAAKHCGREFSDQEGKPWWEVIGVKIKDIKRACNYMAMIYEYAVPKTAWYNHAYFVLEYEVLMGIDFTRNNPLRNEDRLRYVSTPEDGTENNRTRARAMSNASPESGSRSSRTESRSGSEGGKRPRDDSSRTEEGEVPDEAVRKKLRLNEDLPVNGTDSGDESRRKVNDDKGIIPNTPRNESGELEEGELDD